MGSLFVRRDIVNADGLNEPGCALIEVRDMERSALSEKQISTGLDPCLLLRRRRAADSHQQARAIRGLRRPDSPAERAPDLERADAQGPNQ